MSSFQFYILIDRIKLKEKFNTIYANCPHTSAFLFREVTNKMRCVIYVLVLVRILVSFVYNCKSLYKYT